MVELQTENWLTLSQAAKLVPGKPHPATIWRWCRDGANGVRLAFIKSGARIVVSERALIEFLERSTQADAERFEAARLARHAERAVAKAATPRPPSERRRQREIEQARENLRRHGVKL